MKTIRFLCLHGMEDNAQIFRAQTESLRALLPTTYQFEFIDGTHLCDPVHPSVEAVYAGPYLCWYTSPSVSRMAAAHAAVRAYIASEGSHSRNSFHIILGFSQGAAVAASLLLHDVLERHHQNSAPQPPLFSAAVFMCSPLPFSKSLAYGVDVRRYFGLDSGPSLEQLGFGSKRLSSISANLVPPDPRYLRADPIELDHSHLDLHAEHVVGRPSTPAPPPPDFCHGGPFYQMFHPTSDPEIKIDIPTAHIIGKRDLLWRNHSLDLVNMCSFRDNGGTNSSVLRYVYEFNGGHEVPKDEAEIADVCDIIEMLVSKVGSLA